MREAKDIDQRIRTTTPIQLDRAAMNRGRRGVRLGISHFAKTREGCSSTLALTVCVRYSSLVPAIPSARVFPCLKFGKSRLMDIIHNPMPASLSGPSTMI